MTAYSETRRQLVHITMGGLALLLRYLTWQQAALMALVALVFNLFFLARVSPSIIRPGDAGGHRAGVLFYPLSVLLLILVFRDQLGLAAAAWGVLAFGDGAATIAGTRAGGSRLPWNPEKSWAGLIAFFLAGAIGAVALEKWVSPELGIYGPVLAAFVAAFVETIPIKLDDNLTVPFAAAATLILVSTSDPSALATIAPGVWPWAIGVNVAMALAAWLRGSFTITGCIVGTLLGVVIYVGGGPGAWGLLLIAFALAVISSRIGRARKTRLAVAEPQGERRGAGNAIANCLVGAIGAWEMLMSPSSPVGPLLLMSGLVAGASDTVASEIGKAVGGVTRAFPSLAIAPPGTPGAISLVGTLAGLATAVAMALGGNYLLGVRLAIPVVVGATVGAFAESALATRFESRGILNNDTLNFINTVVAASMSLVAWQLL